MTRLFIPTVHLNGTSRDELQRQLLTAAHAVAAARVATEDATPNGRDYYPQGPRAFLHAMVQHNDRLYRLRQVENELLEMFEAIVDVEKVLP